MMINCKYWYECGWIKEELCNDKCEKYKLDVHPFDCKCPDCDADRGCYLFHFHQAMGEFD